MIFNIINSLHNLYENTYIIIFKLKENENTFLSAQLSIRFLDSDLIQYQTDHILNLYIFGNQQLSKIVFFVRYNIKSLPFKT
jgi:hypothetical protein